MANNLKMANKASMAIELKEMTFYPGLEEEEKAEKPARAPVENRPVTVNVPHLPNPPSSSTGARMNSTTPGMTPIVPVSSVPPPLSFIEEQKRREQARAEEIKNQPIPGAPPVRLSVPPMQPAYLTVECSGCRGLIQYPPNVSIVFCTACRATTATRPLINIVCMYCRASAYYPADNSHVRCRCGMVYSIRPA